jgi:proteinaceous RNase P
LHHLHRLWCCLSFAALQVSNDQLRDHVWNLLRPKHMLKWTQRHIIRFAFNFHKTQAYLQNPLPYTPCVQQVGQQGVWLLPEAGEGQGDAGDAGELQQQQQQGEDGKQQQQVRWLCCKAV